MSNTLKKLAENLAVSAIAVSVTLLALEFVVFRYILVPDDVLPNVTINSVVRYQPNTHATFRHPDGSTTKVTINAQGWNSRHPSYDVTPPGSMKRIAVIGDSYVHNKFVETDETFTALLEDKLNASGVPAQVYRFGMDGAPLSQYLHVLRSEVLKYKPDVVVIPLIHNDFDEMYRGLKSRYASSFMKLRRRADGSVEEVMPANFRPGLADRMRASATFRYLYYETNLYLYAKRWINRLYWGGTEDWDPAFVSSAVDIRKINDHKRNRFFARYVMQEMKALSAKHQFKLIFAMDGVRDAIYDGRKPMDYEVGRLNALTRELTGELGIEFLDFHQTFVRDYVLSRKRFEFSYDWHWNTRGNRLIADALLPLVKKALIAPASKALDQSSQQDAAVAKPTDVKPSDADKKPDGLKQETSLTVRQPG